MSNAPTSEEPLEVLVTQSGTPERARLRITLTGKHINRQSQDTVKSPLLPTVQEANIPVLNSYPHFNSCDGTTVLTCVIDAPFIHCGPFAYRK